MPMNAGFFDNPYCSVRKAYQASHSCFNELWRGVDRNVCDVKTPFEQFDFGLGLVIPVNAAPGPRIAGSRLFGHNHNTPQLSFSRVSKTAGLFAGRRLERRDRQSLHIHHEVVTVESVPVDLVALEGRGSLQRDLGSAGFRRESITERREPDASAVVVKRGKAATPAPMAAMPLTKVRRPGDDGSMLFCFVDQIFSS